MFVDPVEENKELGCCLLEQRLPQDRAQKIRMKRQEQMSS